MKIQRATYYGKVFAHDPKRMRSSMPIDKAPELSAERFSKLTLRMAMETVLTKIQPQANTLMFGLRTNGIILKNLRHDVLKPGNPIKQKDWFVRAEVLAFDSISRIQHSTVHNCPAAAVVPKVMQLTPYHKYRRIFVKVPAFTKPEHYPTGHPFSAKAYFYISSSSAVEARLPPP